MSGRQQRWQVLQALVVTKLERGLGDCLRHKVASGLIIYELMGLCRYVFLLARMGKHSSHHGGQLSLLMIAEATLGGHNSCSTSGFQACLHCQGTHVYC